MNDVSDALATYHTHLHSGRPEAALSSLLGALDAVRARLGAAADTEAREVDVTIALAAAEQSLILHDPGLSWELFDEADTLADCVAAEQRRRWRTTVLAHRLRCLLEMGDAEEADLKLAEAYPDLLGACAGGDETVDAWEARNPWLSKTPDVAALLFYGVALLLAAHGSLQRASNLLLRASSRGSSADPAFTSRLLGLRVELAQALIRLQTGAIADATEPLTQLIDEMAHAPHALRLRARIILARALLTAGNLGAALTELERLLADATAANAPGAVVRLMIQSAHLFLFVNRAKLARCVLERLERLPMAPDQSVVNAELSLLRAAIEARTRAPGGSGPPITVLYGAAGREGTGTASSAVEMPDAIDASPAYDHDAKLATWIHVIRIRLDANDIPGARQNLERCFRALRHVDSPLLALRLDLVSALVLAHEGKQEAALGLAARADREAERLGANLDAWQTAAVVSALAESVGDKVTRDRARASVAIRLEKCARTLDPAIAEFFLLDKYGDLDAEVERRLRAGALERQHHTGLRRLLAFLPERETRAVRMAYREARTSRMGGARGRRGPLGPLPIPGWMFWVGRRRHAALSFVVLRFTTLLVLQVAGDIHWIVVPLDAEALIEAIQAWHAASRHTFVAVSAGRSRSPEEQARALAAARDAAERAADRITGLLGLGAMLARIPDRVVRLHLQLDGPLFGLPFAALRFNGRYLVERFELALRTVVRPIGTTNDDGPLSVAGVRSALVLRRTANGRATHFPLLAGVESEIRNVVEAWRRDNVPIRVQSDWDTGDEGPSRSSVLAALGSSSRVHIACHGLFDPADPGRSGLILPGENDADVLSISDVKAITRAPAYVGLSACYTADCMAVPSQPPFSLPHALLQVGARVVLASSWPIDDAAAPALMKAYHAALKSCDPVGALAHAQRAAIQGQLSADPAASLPSYWANYVVYERVDRDLW